MSDPIIIRPSMLPSVADCMRRAFTAADSPIARDMGAAGFPISHLRKLRPGIGLAVGTAVDAGVTTMLSDVTARALDAAMEAFWNAVKPGCEYDTVTPNPATAEKQILSMLSVYRTQVVPTFEPLHVQIELSAAAGFEIGKSGTRYDFRLVGHPDVIDTVLRLHDLKTGQDRWPSAAQLGGYTLLARANGIDLTGAQIDYIERAPLESRPRTGMIRVPKAQPPAVRIDYDLDAARKYAVAVIKHVRRAAVEFKESGDPNAIPANPMSQMCSKKWCPAWGTKFCEVATK
jgi:hypothetical protein